MSAESIRTIEAFVRTRRRGYVVASALRISLVAIAVLGLAAALLIFLFMYIPLAILPLLTVLLLAAMAGAFPLIWLYGYLRRPSLLAIARMLEKELPAERHMLSLSLELAVDGSPLSRMTQERAAGELGRYRWVLHRRPLREMIACALSLILLGASGGIFGSAIGPWLADPFAVLAPQDAELLPGTCRVAAGTNARIVVKPRHRGSPSAVLELRQTGGTLRRVLLRPNAEGSFSYATGPLSGSLEYGCRLSGRFFGPDTIVVVPPPSLSHLTVRIVPPAGLGLGPVDLPQGRGDIAAIAGSTAIVRLASSHPLAHAFRVGRFGSRGDSLAMTVAGSSATIRFTVAAEGAYRFVLADSLGQRSTSAEFALRLLADRAPIVRFVRPGENRAVDRSMQEELLIAAADDYGLSRLVLHWRTGAGARDSIAVPLPRGQRSVDIAYAWNLRPLGLYPGDTVFYGARVSDARGQTDSSATFWFRVPGFAEIHARASEKADEAGSTMASVKRMQKEAAQKLKELSRAADKAAKEGSEPRYEDRKIAEDLKKTMTASADSLQKAVTDLQKAIEEMKGSQNTAVLADKMSELRKAVAELVKQYGDSALVDKRKDAGPPSAADLRASVENLKKMLPNLAQRLEQALRAIEALKRNLALGSLVKSAEDLAREQALLAASEMPAAETAAREKSIADRAQQLARNVSDYMRQDSSLRPESVPSLADVRKESAAMAAASKAGAKPGKNEMAQMSGSLSSMADELAAQMQQDMSAAARADKERLLAAAGDALVLSQWHSPLDNAWPRSEEDRAAAAQTMQAGRDALRNLRARLDSVATLSPADLVEAMAALSKADGALADRIAQMSGAGMRPGIMGASMNGLSKELLAAAKKAGGGQQGQGQSGGGGSGAGGEGGMQQVSGKQAAVNSLTADMLSQMLKGRGGSGEGGGESGAEGKEGSAGSSAREGARRAQGGIAQKLRELAGEYGRDGQGGMAKRATQLAEEAERIARQMADPTADIGTKQDQLLSRMLDASLSVNKKKDEGEERKSESATGVYGPNGAGTGVIPLGSDAYTRLRAEILSGPMDPATRKMMGAFVDSIGVLMLEGQ